jgi:hypothetical protein
MPTTPNLDLPYPTLADPADVPADIEALATKLDGTVELGRLLAVKTYIPAGNVDIGCPPAVWICPHGTDPNMEIGPVIAPASGRVLVKMAGGLIATNGGGAILAGITTSPAANPLASNPIGSLLANQQVPYFREEVLGGLTAGDRYTFVPWVYVAATNGDWYLSNSGLAGGGFLMQVHSA